MNFMTAVRLSIASLALGVTACTTELTSVSAGSSVPAQAFGYYLPREIYSITVTYELVSCPDPALGELSNVNPPVIIQTATIEPIDIADYDQHYYITFEEMNSSWKNTAFQASLYPNQTLKSVGATISSQAAQVASNIISGALSAAKLAGALAPPSGTLTCKKSIISALTVKKQINTDLSQYKPSKDTTKAGAPLVASGARATDTDVSASQQIPTIQASFFFDPQKPLDAQVIRPHANLLSQWFDGDTTKQPLDQLMATTVIVGSNQSSMQSDARPVGKIPGIVYRDPMPATIVVCSGNKTITEDDRCDTAPPLNQEISNQIIATKNVQIPQFGPFVVMSLKNSWFDNNNLAMAFSGNGVPCALAYASQSQLYQISTIFNAGSSSGSGGSKSSSGSGSSVKGSSTGGGGSGGGSSGSSGTGGTGGGSGGGGGGGQSNSSSELPSAPSTTCSS